jgi:hypothetical protein
MLPSRAEVKDEWSSTSSPSLAFMACTGATFNFTDKVDITFYVIHNVHLLTVHILYQQNALIKNTIKTS